MASTSTASNTDPYLLQEDERNGRNLRPHTLHDHEQHHSHASGDGAGDGGGASPSGSRSRSNRLNDFASHILDSHGPQDHHHEHVHEHQPAHEHGDEHEHEHEHDHTHTHVLSFTGEGGVLESQVGVGTFDTDVENAMRQAMDDGEFQPHIEGHGHHHGQEHEHVDPGHEQEQGGVDATATRPVRRTNYTRGRKRKAGDVDHNGEPVDPIQLKKENHKEVERKRRTNINEGIDLLVAQINIPDLEKQGKGVQLRRAVEHVAELDERIMSYEKEVHELRKEKQDLEANLALTSQRYTEEHERCIRFETLWRDAQEREAKSQFDIAQLLDEMAQLRRQMTE